MKKALEQKIKDLFKYRKLPILLKLAGTTKKKEKVFYKQLMELQAAIYDLDVYLESNWKLDNSEITDRWKPIFAALTVLKVPKNKQPHYLRQILKYQKHEIAMRKGKLPTDYTMEYYYYYKSCDVKLIRQLIYDKFPDLKGHIKLSDWRLFDLVTEVVDDLMDVIEDTEVYNGNRFVISALTKKKKKTFAEFDIFLNSIDDKLDEEKWDDSKYERLKNWTENVVFEADELLDELAGDYPKSLLKQSKIAKKIK